MDRFKTHGDFSWAELVTTDLEAAKTFYREVFGWELAESPMPGTEGYILVKTAGKEVGGMTRMPPGMPPGTPPHWLVYVTVRDVDEVAKKVEDFGGRLLVPPADIPDVGRFCMFQDPQGAVISAIQYSQDM